MTKASLALLSLMVGIISAAEIEFKNNRGIVPVVQHGTKRQIDFSYDGSSNGRPAVNSASYRQQSSGSQIPLQQPYRPSSVGSTKPSNSLLQVGVTGHLQQQQEQQSKTPVNSESTATFQQRANPASQSSSFSQPAPSEEVFAPFTAENSKLPPARPFRQSNSRPFSTLEQRQIGNKAPEFERGFPDGFTSGLPAFDFQGRMPDADDKSEGFMDGALSGFPNLKSFGGFDPLPENAREDSIIIPSLKSHGNGRLGGYRPAQFSGRPLAN